MKRDRSETQSCGGGGKREVVRGRRGGEVKVCERRERWGEGFFRPGTAKYFSPGTESNFLKD